MRWTMKSMKDKFFYIHPRYILMLLTKMLQKMKYWIYYTMKIKFSLKKIVAKTNGWNWSALNHIQITQQNWSIVQQLEWLVYVHNKPIVIMIFFGLATFWLWAHFGFQLWSPIFILVFKIMIYNNLNHI